MTETLWAPWRMEYIVSDKNGDCVFCDALNKGPSKHMENLVLCEAKTAFVMMNRYPYTHAHIMAIPKRHVSRLGDLDADERRGFFDLLIHAQEALEKALHPHGMNLGMNLGAAAGAGIKDHIHVHIVPRWNGDTNFMPVLGDTRVMPEHLSETYEKLQSFFSNLGQRTQ